MKELSFEEMEIVEAGWTWVTSVDVLCAAFGIAAICSKGVLLAVPGMLELGTGCALWGAARFFFS